MGRQLEPPGWRRLRLAVLARDQGICWLCDQPGATTVDHIIPRTLGGGHDPRNLRAAHDLCNKRRGIRPVLPRARVSRRWG